MIGAYIMTMMAIIAIIVLLIFNEWLYSNKSKNGVFKDNFKDFSLQSLFTQTNTIWQNKDDFDWLCKVNVNISLTEIQSISKKHSSLKFTNLNYLSLKWQKISTLKDYTGKTYQQTIQKIGTSGRGKIIFSISDLEAISNIIDYQIARVHYSNSFKCYLPEVQKELFMIIVRLLSQKGITLLSNSIV